jgi:hypothetical protein
MKKRYLFFLAGCLALLACQLNPLENRSWDVDVLAPLAYSEVDLKDLVNDSSLLTTGDDGLLTLVYRDTLASQRLGEYVAFSDTPTLRVFRLDTLELSTDTVKQKFTLAELAQQLADDGNILGTLILLNDGNIFPVVPATPGLSSGQINIDGSDFFEYADLKSGQLVLGITNEFPVDLDSVIIEIKNANLPGLPLVRDTFPVIPTRTSVTKTYDLSGREVESALQGELVRMDLQQADSVLINLEDYIEVSIVAEKMQARSATAIFPPQVLLDESRVNIYDLTTDYGEDIELTRMLVRSGKIRAETESTVEDSVQLSYRLTSANNPLGQVPGVAFKLLPAPPGGSSVQVVEDDLGGFLIDLSAGDSAFNLLEDQVLVELLESGNLVSLDQNDSVKILFSLQEIIPTYVEGYLGQAVYELSDTEPLDVFSQLDAELLRVSTPRAFVTFANSVGAEADLTIRDLSAINQSSGESRRLATEAFLAGPLRLQAPLLPDTQGVATRRIEILPENSNFADFLNLQPDQVRYDLLLRFNPDGRPPFPNFATDNSQLAAYLDIEVPLRGQARGVELRDTVEVDFGETDLGRVGEGTFTLLLENDYPLGGTVTAFLVDEGGNQLLSLADSQPLIAGQLRADGSVGQPGITAFDVTLSREVLDRALSEGQRLILRYRLSTEPAGEEVRLYGNHRIRAKLTGEFAYRVEP